MKTFIKYISLLLCSGLIIPLCGERIKLPIENPSQKFTDTIEVSTPLFVELTEKLILSFRFFR